MNQQIDLREILTDAHLSQETSSSRSNKGHDRMCQRETLSAANSKI